MITSCTKFKTLCTILDYVLLSNPTPDLVSTSKHKCKTSSRPGETPFARGRAAAGQIRRGRKADETLKTIRDRLPAGSGGSHIVLRAVDCGGGNVKAGGVEGVVLGRAPAGHGVV